MGFGHRGGPALDQLHHRRMFVIQAKLVGNGTKHADTAVPHFEEHRARVQPNAEAGGDGTRVLDGIVQHFGKCVMDDAFDIPAQQGIEIEPHGRFVVDPALVGIFQFQRFRYLPGGRGLRGDKVARLTGGAGLDHLARSNQGSEALAQSLAGDAQVAAQVRPGGRGMTLQVFQQTIGFGLGHDDGRIRIVNLLSTKSHLIVNLSHV
jgi:hypothetical protein